MHSLEEVLERVAKQLTTFRKNRGWSYADVSALITSLGGEVGPKTIENIEKQATKYEFRSLYWIARGMGISVGELLEFTVQDVDQRARTQLSAVMRMQDRDRVFIMTVMRYILQRGKLLGGQTNNSESA